VLEFQLELGGTMKVGMLAILAAACAFLAPACRAQPTSRDMTKGDGFLNVCGAPNSDPDVCDMYIFGIFQGIDLYRDIAVEHTGKADPTNLGTVCAKDPVSPDQLKHIVVRYIQAHPEQQETGLDTAYFALLAFEHAFPCSVSATKR
jgi:hypothetical protein